MASQKSPVSKSSKSKESSNGKQSNKSDSMACVEHGIWTPLSTSAPATTNLVFTPKHSGAMTFHMVGCSGDPQETGPGLAVAGGMASQIAKPVSPAVAPSFFYHLGDIAYPKSGKIMTGDLWNTQFYAQYAAYADSHGPLPVFGVAGNHDGNSGTAPDTEIGHFMQNMCGRAGAVSPDNQADKARTESTLPYPYWRLDTPLAWIIGLYTNVANGGILDDPQKPIDPKKGQLKWLVDQLTWCKEQNAKGSPKAILLALHYPPFNGTKDFKERGDPALGRSPGAASNGQPIGNVLQDAFSKAGQIPDAIFSAHAHLYQRITVAYRDGKGNVTQQVPCFIVGCGGHTQLELMATKCGGGTKSDFPAFPFDLFKDGFPPKALTPPAKGKVTIEHYADGSKPEDQPYGFLTVTLTPGAATTHPTLACQFYATPCDSKGKQVNPGAVKLKDSCTLDLTTHLLV